MKLQQQCTTIRITTIKTTTTGTIIHNNYNTEANDSSISSIIRINAGITITTPAQTTISANVTTTIRNNNNKTTNI